MERRRRHGVLAASCLAALLGFGASLPPPATASRDRDGHGATPAPAPTPAPVPADRTYDRDLQAYRGELTTEAIDALANDDPAPALSIGKATPGPWAITRLFGSLPDDLHAVLRNGGALKWSVNDLPKLQRQWIREFAKAAEQRGEGPFPLEGKGAAVTGFAGLEVFEGKPVQYFWWLTAEKAHRPVWLTLVRAVGQLAPGYNAAYQDRIQELLEQPNSAPVPPARWVRIKEAPPRPEPPKKSSRIDEEYYWSCVRAYRGQLSGQAREQLEWRDPLVAKRSRATDAVTHALNQLFARMSDKDHRLLLSEGRVSWSPQQLTAEQRRWIEPVLEQLNRDAGGAALYVLAPYRGASTGFALVRVPGVEQPAISWWVQIPSVPNPAWITIANEAATKAPDYYRAHLEQLGAIQR